MGGPTFDAVTTRSDHPGGLVLLLGAGSVRFLKDSVAGANRRALGTVSGGEMVSADGYSEEQTGPRRPGSDAEW